MSTLQALSIQKGASSNCGEGGGRQRTSRRADGLTGELESVSPFLRTTVCERDLKCTSHPQNMPEGGGTRGWRCLGVLLPTHADIWSLDGQHVPARSEAA